MTKTQNQAQGQEYLSTAQVCALLNVTRQTVVNLVKRGALPKQKRMVGIGLGGARVYYLRADVEKLLTPTVSTGAPVAVPTSASKPRASAPKRARKAAAQ